MMALRTIGPMRYFAELPDPRAANVRHRLIDRLTMALCATLCGADGWDDYADFVRVKAEWFVDFLDLKHGPPSADTFRRVFSRLNPEAFERCFANWMAAVVDLSQGKLLAIDGKSIRRDHAPENVSRLRRIALNLLRIHGDRHTKRKSIRGRRKIAGWDPQFLLHLITG